MAHRMWQDRREKHRGDATTGVMVASNSQSGDSMERHRGDAATGVMVASYSQSGDDTRAASSLVESDAPPPYDSLLGQDPPAYDSLSSSYNPKLLQTSATVV